jgi:hypothetical protein
MLRTVEPKKVFDIQFSLNSHSGNLNFGLKTCSKVEDCKFDKVFTKSDAITKPDGNWVMVNDIFEPHKTVAAALKCSKENAAIITPLENGSEEKMCFVGVAVYGAATHSHHYNLSFHDKDTALLLPAKQQMPIRLIEQNKKFLQFNFKPDNEANYTGIDFTFDVNYGAVQVKISKGDNNICKDDLDDPTKAVMPELMKSFDHSTNNIFGQKHHVQYKPTDAKDGKLEGTYYICVIAQRTSYILFNI